MKKIMEVNESDNRGDDEWFDDGNDNRGEEYNDDRGKKDDDAWKWVCDEEMKEVKCWIT